MKGFSESMSRLVAAFTKLPGIGRRSAERIVFYLLRARQEEVAEFAVLLSTLKEKTIFCEICHNFSDQKICHICSDPGRDKGIVCIVEEPKDVIAVEKTGSYVGVYHVLHGALSALEGIGPQELQIQDLIGRIKGEKIREIILATNPNTEGETTALYLARVLSSPKVKVTRLAHGISVGSMLEYTDQATLARALDGRVLV